MLHDEANEERAELFAELGAVVDVLKTHAVEVYEKGALIVEKGPSDRAMFRIERGEVEIFDRLEDGTEVVFGVLGAGEYLGEMALIDGRDRTRSVRCRSACELVRVCFDGVESLPKEQALLFWKGLCALVVERFRQSAKIQNTLFEERPETIDTVLERRGGERIWVFRGRAVRNAPDAIRSVVEEIKKDFVSLQRRARGADHEKPALRDETRSVLDRVSALLDEVETATRKAFGDDDRGWDHMRDAGRFILRELYPHLMRSLLAERLYLEPKGLALDYLTMEHICTASPEGEGALGMWIDTWFLRGPWSGVARARWEWAARALDREATRIYLEDRSGYQTIEVMALGLGLGQEMFDFLTACQFSERLHITCLDVDIEALRYANARSDANPHRAEMRFVRDSINHMLRDTSAFYPTQDIVYALWHPELLASDTLVRFMNRCYTLLKPSGALILTHRTPEIQKSAFAQHVLAMPWRMRTAEDLKGLVERSLFETEHAVVQHGLGGQDVRMILRKRSVETLIPPTLDPTPRHLDEDEGPKAFVEDAYSIDASMDEIDSVDEV